MNISEVTCLILCGGKGERATHLPEGCPKFLTPIREDKVFANYLLEYLANQGIKKIVLSLGHYKEEIIQFVSKLETSIDIHWDWDLRLLGPLAAIEHAINSRYSAGFKLLNTNPIMVINDDTFLDVDLNYALSKFKRTKDIGHVFARKYPSGLEGELFHCGITFYSQRCLKQGLVSEKLINIPITKSNYLDIGTPEGYESIENWLYS